MDKKLLIFLALAALLVFSSFYRIQNAVIGPDLMSEFRIGPEALGTLGSAFFYSFATLQFVVGPLLDRAGPRLVIAVFAVIGGVGAILFSMSGTFMAALIGRILLGAGMAAMLMGALKAFTILFLPDKFSSYAGLLTSLGTLGYIMASTPFVHLNRIAGWRVTTFVAGAITILLGALLFRWLEKWGSPAEREAAAMPQDKGLTPLRSLITIFGSLSFWQVSLTAFCRYGAFASLQGVWLALYLMDIASYSSMQAGNMLLVLSIGTILGSPCAGWLYDRFPGRKKAVVISGLSLYSLSLVPLVGLFTIQSTIWYGAVCLSLGFFGGSGMLLYSYAKELFPANLSATAMASVNSFMMFGGAVFTQLTGTIVQFLSNADGSRSATAYHAAFFVCFMSLSISLAFFGLIHPAMGKQDQQQKEGRG